MHQPENQAIEQVEDLELTSEQSEGINGGATAYDPAFQGGIFVAVADVNEGQKATDVTLKRGVI